MYQRNDLANNFTDVELLFTVKILIGSRPSIHSFMEGNLHPPKRGRPKKDFHSIPTLPSYLKTNLNDISFKKLEYEEMCRLYESPKEASRGTAYKKALAI